jgi:hypothetical protein
MSSISNKRFGTYEPQAGLKVTGCHHTCKGEFHYRVGIGSLEAHPWPLD